MFGLLLYSLGCMGAAGLLTMARALVLRASRIGEGGNAFFLFMVWIAVMAAPYGWVEAQTSRHRQEFAPVVAEICKDKKIEGDLVYFKVQSEGNGKAKLLMVTSGENNWGGTYRDVYSVRLEQSATGWWVKEVDPVNTTDGDSAGFTFPPYW